MTDHPTTRAFPARSPGRVLAALSSALALVVLMVGWGLGQDWLFRQGPEYAVMVPATALGFVLLGLTFEAARAGRSRILGLLLGALGLLVALDVTLLSDTLLRGNEGDQLSVITAICFALIAVAIAGLSPGADRPAVMSDLCATLAGGVALVAVAGHLFNPDALNDVPVFAEMSLLTAICALLLSTAILVERRRDSWMRHLLGPGRGSLAARRVFPAVILGPFVLCFVTLLLTQVDVINPDLRLALLAVALTATGLVAVLNNAATENAVEIREQEQQARVAGLIDAIDAAIVAFDATGKVQFTNVTADRWVTAAGYDAPGEWIANSTYVDSVTFDPVASSALPILRPWTLRDSAAEAATVLGRIQADGSHQILLFTPGEWPQTNGETQHILMIRDVTEEAAASRTRQQVERVGLLGEIAGGIAHDMANLLGVIRLSVDVAALQTELAPMQEHLEAVRAACERGSEMTSRVLTFVQRDEMEIGPVDLPSLLDGIVGFSRRTLPAGIEITLQPTETDVRVLSEPGLLESALLNLVVNARNAIAESGVGACVALSLIVRDAEVEIVVSDDGPGMSDTLLSRVDEPFFTTRTETGGTGLGLSTVRRCAEATGGRFEIVSPEGSGVTARLILPRVTDTTASPDTPTTATRLDGRKILYIEDDPSFGAIVADILTHAGAQVFLETTGSAGAARLERQDGRIDLVLTDLQLPGEMSGADLVRHCRRRYPALPVVVLSGMATAVSDLRGIGVTALSKPIGAADLLSRIDTTLRG